MNEFERWANFYLLTSAAAATLIGLLFVVITLGAERGVIVLFHYPQPGLTLVAVGMLALLTLGIRNSWAVAIDVSTRPRRQNQK
jgi:hypothetical protein